MKDRTGGVRRFHSPTPIATWDNRKMTARMKRAERASRRVRFNNKPEPLGTLPKETFVQHVRIMS